MTTKLDCVNIRYDKGGAIVYDREILNLRWQSGVFLPTGEHYDVLLHMVAQQYGFANAYELLIDNEKTHKWIIFDKELPRECRRIERSV